MLSRAKRYAQIFTILHQEGLTDLFKGTKLEKYIPPTIVHKNRDQPVEVRLRIALERLGSTFIKLGQAMSKRPDVFPEKYITQFEELQENVTPVSLDVYKVLTQYLGEEKVALINWIDENPIGVASIGQVYKAKLETEEDVVLKIRKPGAKEEVTLDLEIMQELVGASKLFSKEVSRMGIQNAFDSFRNSMLQEIDYTRELSNTKRFKKMYASYEGIYSPDVFDEFSGEEVLCLEYLEGTKFTYNEEIDKTGIDRKALATRGTEFYFYQIISKGFYHADPHAGNLMINDRGDLVLMDFGLVGTLSARDKDDILDFLKLMMQNDAHGFVRKLQTVAVSMHVENGSELETSLGYIFEELNANVNDFNIAEVAMNFQTVISKSQIILPENYYLLLRTLSMLEGMVRVIDPTYNFVGEIQPILMKYIMQNYSPKNLLKKAFGSLKDLDYALTIGPKKILSIVDKLEDGQIKVQFEVNHLKESVESGEKVINRLSMTLFIVGLMLCSTILLAFKIPPVIWEETSLLGLVGFTTSFILILFTLLMIYRKRI